MNFDWEEYKTLAEELGERSDEAARRSAISRLYYSVYWQARIYLEENQNYLFSENKEPHAQIWQEFIRKGKIFKRIGETGRLLRNKRNNADYDQEILKIEDELVTSFRWANQILNDLNKIQSKDQN